MGLPPPDTQYDYDPRFTKSVQRLLGHETAAMTLGLYAHLFSDDLTKVAESLNTAAMATYEHVSE